MQKNTLRIYTNQAEKEQVILAQYYVCVIINIHEQEQIDDVQGAQLPGCNGLRQSTYTSIYVPQIVLICF